MQTNLRGDINQRHVGKEIKSNILRALKAKNFQASLSYQEEGLIRLQA